MFDLSFSSLMLRLTSNKTHSRFRGLIDSQALPCPAHNNLNFVGIRWHGMSVHLPSVLRSVDASGFKA